MGIIGIENMDLIRWNGDIARVISGGQMIRVQPIQEEGRVHIRPANLLNDYRAGVEIGPLEVVDQQKLDAVLDWVIHQSDESMTSERIRELARDLDG